MAPKNHNPSKLALSAPQPDKNNNRSQQVATAPRPAVDNILGPVMNTITVNRLISKVSYISLNNKANNLALLSIVILLMYDFFWQNFNKPDFKNVSYLNPYVASMITLIGIHSVIFLLLKRTATYSREREKTIQNGLDKELDKVAEKFDNLLIDNPTLSLELLNSLYASSKDYTDLLARDKNFSPLVFIYHYINIIMLAIASLFMLHKIFYLHKPAISFFAFLIENGSLFLSYAVFITNVLLSHQNFFPANYKALDFRMYSNVEELKIFFNRFRFMRIMPIVTNQYFPEEIYADAGGVFLSYKINPFYLDVNRNDIGLSPQISMRIIRAFFNEKYGEDCTCQIDDFNNQLYFLFFQKNLKAFNDQEYLKLFTAMEKALVFEQILLQLNQLTAQKNYSNSDDPNLYWVKGNYVDGAYYFNISLPEDYSQAEVEKFKLFFSSTLKVQVDEIIIDVFEEEGAATATKKQRIIIVRITQPLEKSYFQQKMSAFSKTNKTIKTEQPLVNPFKPEEQKATSHRVAKPNNKNYSTEVRSAVSAKVSNDNTEEIVFKPNAQLSFSIPKDMQVNGYRKINHQVGLIKLKPNLFAILDNTQHYFTKKEFKNTETALQNGIKSAKANQGIVWDPPTRSYKLKTLGAQGEGDRRVLSYSIRADNANAHLIIFDSSNNVTNYHALAKRHHLLATPKL